MAVQLLRPAGDDRAGGGEDAVDWYLERVEPPDTAIDLYRPLFQGDVFVGVPLEHVPLTDVDRGGDDDAVLLSDAVMLVGHPCSMVAGAQRLPYQEVVRVRPTAFAHYDDYDKRRFAEFFLPFLDPANPAAHYNAFLHERTLVDTSALDVRNRVAALSLHGVVALQQRMTHESSRVKVAPQLLREATEPRFVEVDMAADWNREVLERDRLEGDELFRAMEREASQFDAALSAKITTKDATSGYVLSTTLRQELFRAERVGAVRIAVRTHIKQRKSTAAAARQQAAQRAERDRTANEGAPQADRSPEGGA